MDFVDLKASRGNVECAKIRIFDLFTQCLKEIEKTASISGLTMKDVGVDVEKYNLSGESYIVEMKLQI